MSKTSAKTRRTHFQRIAEAALRVFWKVSLLKKACSALNYLNQRGTTQRYQFNHRWITIASSRISQWVLTKNSLASHPSKHKINLTHAALMRLILALLILSQCQSISLATSRAVSELRSAMAKLRAKKLKKSNFILQMTSFPTLSMRLCKA